MTKLDFEAVTGGVIGGYYTVFNNVPPGLSEGVYQRSMCVELRHLGIPFVTEQRYTVRLRGVDVGVYRADIVVADTLIVEIKTGTSITKEAIRQVLCYLRTSNLPVGLILNFGPEPSFRRITL